MIERFLQKYPLKTDNNKWDTVSKNFKFIFMSTLVIKWFSVKLKGSTEAWEAGTKASNTTAKAFMKNGIFVNRQNLIRRGDHISQGDISVRVVVKFSSALFKICSDLLINMKQNVLKGIFVFWCSNFRQFWFTKVMF